MPQIVPGGTNSNPPAPVQNDPPASPWGAPQPNNPSPWGWGGGMGGQNPNEKRLTPQERVEMIEKVYQEILNRKPDTKDINYYKYSTLSEEEIRKQILTGKEHKQLMEDGREYKKMKERAIQAETRVNMLEAQIKDQVQEFRHLTELLTEKNQYIHQLRVQNNNPYNLVQPTATQLPPEAHQNTVNTPSLPDNHFSKLDTPKEVSKKKGLRDRIRDMLVNLIPE